MKERLLMARIVIHYNKKCDSIYTCMYVYMYTWVNFIIYFPTYIYIDLHLMMYVFNQWWHFWSTNKILLVFLKFAQDMKKRDGQNNHF